MTKAKPSSFLKMLIDSNLININTTEWVERASMKQESTAPSEFRKSCQCRYIDSQPVIGM